MYSLVLMVAMTSGAEAPTFGGTFWAKHCFFESCYPAHYGWTCGPGWGGYYPGGRYSCQGCYGGCTGCSGVWHVYGSSCHGSCYGYSSCHGCFGGYSYGCSCHGGVGYNWHTCHGCSGASCYGCYGSIPIYPTMGCYGMYGHVSAPINSGSIDPLGLNYNYGTYVNPPAIPAINTTPAVGLGTPSTSGPFTNGIGGGFVLPGDPGTEKGSELLPPVVPEVNKKQSNAAPTVSDILTNLSRPMPAINGKSGSIRVTVPASARVYIEGILMKSEEAVRVFNSPALEDGVAYFYMVKVETVKDGKLHEETRKVSVRAGKVTEVNFTGNDAVNPSNVASSK